MRKILVLVAAAVVLSSCGVVSSPLYYWGGQQSGATTYESLAYGDYKTQSPEAICKLICAYENMVSNPGGTRQLPPPGICAEYGYLLLQPTTATTFIQHATTQQKAVFMGSDYMALFNERGKEMLRRELELYPESRQFIEPLLKKLAQ